MTDLYNRLLSGLRASWGQVLTLHLIYTGLGLMVFVPSLGVLGQALLALSGKPALADMDLLFFALSPVGFVSVVLFSAFAILLAAFEMASLMAVVTVIDGNRPKVSTLSALAFSFTRAPRIFAFGLRLIIKLILLLAPFVLVGTVVAFLLLTEYDINYYLTIRPVQFWWAAAILGVLGLLVLWLLIRRLVDWSLALPLVLFAGKSARSSFPDSRALARANRRKIFSSLFTWAIATLLLGTVATLFIQFLAALLVPAPAGSVANLAIVFGALTLLWLLLNAVLAALMYAALALLLMTLTRQCDPGFTTDDEVTRGDGQLVGIWTRRRLVLAAAAGTCISVLIAYVLLDDIAFEDDAIVIAHRGAAGAAPENTMASIRKAVEDGADWIEIDVQESADGQVVVIHDRDLMKLAGVNLKVSDATVPQLEEIDVGSWFSGEFSDQRVPTLDQVLTEVKGRSKLIVELKYYGQDQQLEQRVIDLIEAAGMRDDIMIMSLEYAGIQKIRALRPDWKIGLLSARAIGDLTRLDVDFLAVNSALARQPLINSTHRSGKELYVWTINDALTMSQMLSLGVDGLITDEPKMGRDVLTSRAGLSTAERLLLHMAPLFGLDPPQLNPAIDAGPQVADGDEREFELELHRKFQHQLTQSAFTASEFATDGCSGGLSKAWNILADRAGEFGNLHGAHPPWEACCIEHDRAYHAGGAGLDASASFDARKLADEELRNCVVSTAERRSSALMEEYQLTQEQVEELYTIIAESMHMAVRLGGVPCSGLSWRWGYGWPDC